MKKVAETAQREVGERVGARCLTHVPVLPGLPDRL